MSSSLESFDDTNFKREYDKASVVPITLAAQIIGKVQDFIFQYCSAPDTLRESVWRQRVSGAVVSWARYQSVLGWVPKCPDFAQLVECPDAKCSIFARNFAR
jgi:hypothetical protein